MILCIVCAQLCGFQHLDAFGLERGAQSLGKAGARHLVLDAEGDDAMQAGAFQTDGSAVRRHPGLEVLDVPGQLRAGRGEGLTQKSAGKPLMYSPIWKMRFLMLRLAFCW